MTRAVQTALAGSGGVLQVVQATDTTQVNTSAAGNDVDLFSATITPTSSSSKILVLLTIFVGNNPNGGLYLKRGSTKIGSAGGGTSYNDPGNFWNSDELTPNIYGVFCVDFKYLDSPATTAAVTYTYGFRTGGQAPEFSYNRVYASTDSRTRSTITLMEIAG